MISAWLNSKKVLMALQGYTKRLGPEGRQPVNAKIAIQLQGWVFRNFKQEGKLATPGGWAALAPSTIQKRARKIRGKAKRAKVRKLYREGASRKTVAEALGTKFGGRFPILQDTGSLRQSFLPFHDPNTAGVGAVQYINFRGGGDVPTDIAAIHEFGNKKRNIPRRKMLPTKTQATNMAVKVYKYEVAKMIREQKK